MNDIGDLLEPEERFAIGQPVPRTEDPVLLRGEGHYSDDASLPGQAYAVMVRSPYAHGTIRSIDTAAAREMAGVLAVHTVADLVAGGIGPLAPRQVVKNRDGTPMLTRGRLSALATARCGKPTRRWRQSSPRPLRRREMRPERSSSTSTSCRR